MFQGAGCQHSKTFNNLTTFPFLSTNSKIVVNHLPTSSQYLTCSKIVSTLEMICPTFQHDIWHLCSSGKKYEHLKLAANFFNVVKVRMVNCKAWGGYVLEPRKNSHNSQQDKMRDLVSSWERKKNWKERRREEWTI